MLAGDPKLMTDPDHWVRMPTDVVLTETCPPIDPATGDVMRALKCRYVRSDVHAKVEAERDALAEENARLRNALVTIERSGAPNGTMVARRQDDHVCGWCRGMLVPCPVETSRLALAALAEEQGE